jgi:hypothetical protein
MFLMPRPSSVKPFLLVHYKCKPVPEILDLDKHIAQMNHKELTAAFQDSQKHRYVYSQLLCDIFQKEKNAPTKLHFSRDISSVDIYSTDVLLINISSISNFSTDILCTVISSTDIVSTDVLYSRKFYRQLVLRYYFFTAQFCQLD